MSEFIDWSDPSINMRSMRSAPRRLEPQVDVVISQIVGQKIYQLDPRLIRLISKWKREKKGGENEPDNFLQDERKIKELREVLSKPL